MATTSQDDDPSNQQGGGRHRQERSKGLRGDQEERDDSVRRSGEGGEFAAPSVPVLTQPTDPLASAHTPSQTSSSSSTLPSSVASGSQPSKPIRRHKRPLEQLDWVDVPEKRSRKTVEYTGHTALPNLLAPLLASLPSQYQPLLENLTTDLQLHPLPSLPTLSSVEIQLLLDRSIQSKPLAADLSKTEFGDVLSWRERGRFSDVASKLTPRIRYLKTALEDIKAGKRSAEGSKEVKGKGKQRETVGSTSKGSGGEEVERGRREVSSDISSLPSPNTDEMGAALSSSRRSEGSPRPSPSNRTNEEPAPSPIEPSPSSIRPPHSYEAFYSASPISSFPRLSGEDPSSVGLVHPQPQSRRSADLESSSFSSHSAHSQPSQSRQPPPTHPSTSTSHRTRQPRPPSDPNPSTPRDHPNPVAPFLQNPYSALRHSSHVRPSPPPPIRPPPPPFFNPPQSPLPPPNHQSYQASSQPPPQPRRPNPLDPNAHRQLSYHYSSYSPSNQTFPSHQPYPPQPQPQPQHYQQPVDDPRGGQTSEFGRPPPRRRAPSLTFDPSRPTTSSSSSGSPSTSQPVYKEPYLPGPSRACSSWSSDQGGSNQYASPSSSSRSFTSPYPLPPPPPTNFQRPREPPSSFPPPPPPPMAGRGRTPSNLVLDRPPSQGFERRDAPSSPWSSELGPSPGRQVASSPHRVSAFVGESSPGFPNFGGGGGEPSSSNRYLDFPSPLEPNRLPSPSHLVTSFAQSQPWDVNLPPPRQPPLPPSPQRQQHQQTSNYGGPLSSSASSSSSNYPPPPFDFEPQPQAQQQQQTFHPPPQSQPAQPPHPLLQTYHQSPPQPFTTYQPLPPPVQPPLRQFSYSQPPQTQRQVTPPEAFLPPLPLNNQPNAPSHLSQTSFDPSLWRPAPMEGVWEALPDPPQRPPPGDYDFWRRVDEEQEAGWKGSADVGGDDVKGLGTDDGGNAGF